MSSPTEEAWTVEMGCECWEWERDYSSHLFTEHHRRCRHYGERTEFDAAYAIRRLLTAIDQWAAEEDGIPDFVQPTYAMAARVTNYKGGA